jgi:hypothetical protein
MLLLLLLLQSEVMDSSYNNATQPKHRNAKGEKERKKKKLETDISINRI